MLANKTGASKSRVRLLLTGIMLSVIATGFASPHLLAKESISHADVVPMGKWLTFRQAHYTNEPILLHLRTGYERAVLMPESVRLMDDQKNLPGCTLEIDQNVVGFYPTQVFQRRSVTFIGSNSGKKYQLLVSASPTGIRQPLQITH